MEKFIDNQVKLVADMTRLGLADAQFFAGLAQRTVSEVLNHGGNANKAASAASSVVAEAKDYMSSRALKVSSLMANAQSQAQDASRICSDYAKNFMSSAKK